MQPDTVPVTIPYPESGDRHLRFVLGACQLRLRPCECSDWVSGTYRDPTGQMPLKIERDGGAVRLDHVRSLGGFFGLFSGIPVLDLQLGHHQPYMLTIESAATDNELELGGLPITHFALKQGAGRTRINFAVPNPQAMDLFQVSVGAAGLEARGLANARAAVMTLEGGAAGYAFDFGGSLQRDTYVKISTGISSVDLTIPSTTAAKVSSESVLSHLDVGDGFVKREGAFWSPEAFAGRGPVLTVDTSVALGSLSLRFSEGVESRMPELVATTA